MNKIWFRKQKWYEMGGTSSLVPCSIEGWIWILLVVGVASYFGSNFEAGTVNIIGFILTILIGLAVSVSKSK